MARPSILVRFNEAHSYDHPVDDAGTLNPLAPPAGLTAPASDDGVVGRARTWGGASGYYGTEAVVDGARHLRDVTVEAIALLPWATTNGTYRLVTRGKGTSTAERELYGLQLVVSGAPSAPVVSLQMRWQVSGGAAATVAGAAFAPSAGWLYLAAARRWISATEVEVDYYVNGELAGTVKSTGGNIAEGSGGTIMVGCDATPTGMPAGSKLDDWRVAPYARTAEEIRQTFRRMFVFGGYGYELLKSLQPPGDAWTRDPDSRIQRFFQVAGDGLGMAWSKAAELLDDFLPDRAWSFLDRWETITRLAPRAADTLTKRRARILAFMRKVRGYSRDKMLANTSELLDCLPSDLSFIEGTNVLYDDFDGILVKPLWIDDNPLVTAPTVFGSELFFQSDIGIGARWDGAHREAHVLRTSIMAEPGVEVILGVNYVNQTGGNGNAVGLFVLNRITGDAHLFGTKAAAGTLKWYAATIIGGVYSETLGAAVPGGLTPGAHTWLLRYIDRGGGFADLDVQVDGTDFLGTWDHVFLGVPTIAGRAWAGIFVSDTVNPPIAGTQLHASAFQIFAPQSPLAFEWAIFRDPGLGGAPDFEGARQVISKTKPAHTLGAIVETTAAEYDTVPSYYDRSLYGG